MSKNRKQILIILAFACIGLTALFCVNDFAFADRDLEIDYPTVPDADTPGTNPNRPTSLPEYIKYLFNFGIAIGGILAFLILVYGGFLWMTSSGDPTAIGKAKTKMLSGIIGLCLLLGAYLIIGMIDPDLKHLKDIPDMLPKSGIYLCVDGPDCKIDYNDPNRRRRYSGNTTNFVTDDFEPTIVEFISGPEELMSIFTHTEKGFKGLVGEVKNEKKGHWGAVGGANSITFQWNRPGIYLYETEKLEVKNTTYKVPEYLRGSAKNLGEWDNITKSMKIVHPDIEKMISGFLFDEPDYSGKCEHLFDGILDISDRGTGENPLVTTIKDFKAARAKPPSYGGGKPNMVDDLSSIYTFTISTDAEPSGEVFFFDEQNCDGNKFSVPLEDTWLEKGWFREHRFEDAEGNETGSAEGNVLSFEINGPFVVLIMTQDDWGANDLECKIFTKPNDSNCYDTIISSNVFSENNDNIRPRMYYIIPSN